MLSSNAAQVMRETNGRRRMNRIVHFPKRGRLLRRTEVRRGSPAQILFFTGVRYERHVSAQAAAEVDVSQAEGTPGARRSRTGRKKSA